MAEETQTQEPTAAETEQPHGGDATDWKAEARKWERRAKDSNEKLKEMDELRAKAAKLDEIEDAQKSELERISEQATKAQASADDWQAKFEELQARRQHELDVRKAASEFGVDADVLMRMGGDVDENARFLQGKEDARLKFGDMRDGGEQRLAKTLDEELRGAKSTQERIRIRAEHNARNRK